MYNMYSTGIALEETYLSAGRERREKNKQRNCSVCGYLVGAKQQLSAAADYLSQHANVNYLTARPVVVRC